MEYDYPTAFSLWGDEEKCAIARVVKSGRFTMGHETSMFESELAAHCRRKFAVCVNSGSSANLIAVAALTLSSPPPPVPRAFVPAVAWATTYAPLVQHGFDLELGDVDESWNAVVDVRKQPGIIVGCSILGNPANLAACEEAAARFRARFLNDNCESMGALINGRPVESFGDVATLSFFYSHQLSAIEGGAILTDDEELDRLCRMLRDHGMTRTVEAAKNFDSEYDFRVMGYNVRPLELHMAVAREQLLKQEHHRDFRQLNCSTFRRMIAALRIDDRIELPKLTGVCNPFGLHFLCPSREARGRIAQALRAASIDCRMPTGGSLRMHRYGAAWASQQTPRADEVHRRGMFLGNAPFDITDKIARATKVIKEALK